jgi:hypothetical protein
MMLAGVPGWAQEKLPTLPEVMAQVQDTEVYLQGYIGRGPEGNPRFVLPGADKPGFVLIFESDDDLDQKITGCGFEGSGGLPCKMTGYGRVHWEGTKLQVVLTGIESIEPPAGME